MEMKIFSIFDSKAEIYSPPFYKHTHAEAERDFQVLSKDPQSRVSQFPEDFDLFYLGKFDDQSGKIVPLSTPEHIVKAIHAQQKGSKVDSMAMLQKMAETRPTQ